MEIRCPSCGDRITIRGLTAGAHRPACPRCGVRFLLVVSMTGSEPVVLVGASPDKLKPAAMGAGPSEVSAKATAAAALAASPSPGESAPHDVAHKPADRADAGGPQPGSGLHVRRRGGVTRAEAPTLSMPAGPVAVDARPTGAAAGAGDASLRTAPAGSGAPPDRAPPGQVLTGRLDGYELVKAIGHGGMGTVYLARQVSLDRMVAVKTIRPDLAMEPAFISRFTREAFAAAQLTHHNVVQVHDIGEDRRVHYFSMEHVGGWTLARLLEEQGPLDAEQACGYVLQAARGLKFAHDHQMIHRDVKPANLLLNDQGVVKVADLGLVKRGAEPEAARGVGRGAAVRSGAGAGAWTTDTGPMGTPAYMAPEQVRDAAHVDARADIYSLGCTFCALLTGRPPKRGSGVSEWLSGAGVASGASDGPVAPAPSPAKPIPATLAAIIEKMVARRPADRYEKMGQVILALEDFLGITAGPFTPREEHVRVLEGAVRAFERSPRARLRRWLGTGFTIGCAAAFFAALLTGQMAVAHGALGLWLFTALSYGVVAGMARRTHLFRKCRQLLLGATGREWAACLAGVAAAGGLIVFFGLHWVYLGMLGAGVVLGAAFAASVDVLVERERRPQLDAVRQMLRHMRLRGLAEDAVRRFVCKYSGRDWEAFYEALFGYPAKLAARKRWGGDYDGRPRRRYGAWRDGLIEWIEERERRLAERRHRRHLQRIEARRLRAEGKDDYEAARSAREVADTIVDYAVEYRRTGRWTPIPSDEKAEPRRRRGREVLGRRSAAARLADRVLGGGVRLVTGVALLVLYALWAHERDLAQALRDQPGLAGLRALAEVNAAPLNVPGVPPIVMGLLCAHGAALAGLALVLSAPYRGMKMALCLMPALAVWIGGPAWSGLERVPLLGPHEVSLIVGAVVALIGWRIGRYE